MHRLGLLAVVLGDGQIQVLAVPEPAALHAAINANDPQLGTPQVIRKPLNPQL